MLMRLKRRSYAIVDVLRVMSIRCYACLLSWRELSYCLRLPDVDAACRRRLLSCRRY